MKKVSTRKVFMICFLLTTVFGVCNLLLNSNKISTESDLSLPVLCIATAPISLISIGLVIIEVSLIIYFVVAMLNGFVHIKTIMRMVVRSFIWYPVINIINGCAIAIFNIEISKAGIYKMIYYIPFTLLVGLSIYMNIKSALKISNGKRIIISIVGIAATSLLVI